MVAADRSSVCKREGTAVCVCVLVPMPASLSDTDSDTIIIYFSLCSCEGSFNVSCTDQNRPVTSPLKNEHTEEEASRVDTDDMSVCVCVCVRVLLGQFCV